MTADSPTPPPAFGDLLRQHRVKAGLTQRDLAQRAGLSVRGVSDLERGVRARPQRDTLRRLLQALGMSDSARAMFITAARSAPPPTSAGRAQPRETSTAGANEWFGRAPRMAGPLFGRDSEIAAVHTLLAREGPLLVTITGAGGTGKTRLAIAVAAEDASFFPDGVVFVDLTPLGDPALVLPRIAAAFGVQGREIDAPVAALTRWLSGKRVLLVLDNCEHVLGAAPALAELVAACPGLTILATSREPLRIRAERVFPLSPLILPGPEDTSTAALARVPAIALFVERAQTRDPTFTLADDNSATVAAICERLDDLPLAIELAAARLTLLSPAMLLERLQRRLPLLSDGVRDLPARQRTLRDTIGWSYDLLDEAQQRLFRRLAVFAGGFTLNGAARVSDTSREDEAEGGSWTAAGCQTPPPDTRTVLELLSALLDKNLVRRDVDHEGRSRYAMLETIREYASERLREDPEETEVRAAHLDHLLARAEIADLRRRDATFDTRLGRLMAEEANLRAALSWAIDNDAQAALRLVDALGPYWFHLGELGTGLDLTERVLAGCGVDGGTARARALGHAAWLALNLGDFGRAATHAGAARELADHLGADRESAYARFLQGSVAQSRAEVPRAADLLGEALHRFEALPDAWGTFACLSALGVVALDRGDAPGAARLYERALVLVETHQGSRRDRAAVLCNLALTYRYLGRHDAALARATQALALTPPTGVTVGRAGSLEVLALLSLDLGDVSRAAALMRESLEQWSALGDPWSIAVALEAIAAIAAVDRAVDAARLLGAATALRETIAAPASGCAAAALNDLHGTLSLSLGTVAFAQATAAGNSLMPHDAVTAAIAIAAALAFSPDTASG